MSKLCIYEDIYEHILYILLMYEEYELYLDRKSEVDISLLYIDILDIKSINNLRYREQICSVNSSKLERETIKTI